MCIYSFRNLFFPNEVSSEDFKNMVDYRFPEPSDILVMFAYALGILLIRKIFEILICKPLSLKVGIQTKERTKPAPIAKLEELYRISKNPDDELVKEYADIVKLSERGVHHWLRRRRNIDRPLLSAKFTEAFWRGTFYTFTFIFGISTLWQTPWFWDTDQCWVDYRFQKVWPSIYYYYMIEGGFYISLLFSIFKDVKRKDFNEQLIHHLATIFLIVFSYCLNYVRIGSLVMVVHDVSDILLEWAKCALYAKNYKMGDHLFTLFAIVFIVSRLIVYPCVILHSALFKSMPYILSSTNFYFCNVLLLILQALHIFWASIILRMAYRMLVVGKVEKDARSDVEELSSDDAQDHKED